jgi:hypothetical protein
MVKGSGAEGRGLTTFWTVLAIVALWTAAASIEITVPRWGTVFAALGDVYPLPTARVLEIARLHVAWWIAALSSFIIVVLWVRRSRICAVACILSLFISAMAAALTTLAMSLPLYTHELSAPVVSATVPHVRPHKVKRIDNADRIPGLNERVKGMIGQHFFLDNLPDNARTLEAGHDYLMNKTTSQGIRETLNAWKDTYGASLQIDYEGRSVTVLLWSGTADFTGRFVYAVSATNGYPWQVFIAPNRQ